MQVADLLHPTGSAHGGAEGGAGGRTSARVRGDTEAHVIGGGDSSRHRWPVFAPAAREAGVAAVFTFPLRMGAIRVGVLNLYRDSPGGLNRAAAAEALAYAEAAMTVLLHLPLHSRMPPVPSPTGSGVTDPGEVRDIDHLVGAVSKVHVTSPCALRPLGGDQPGTAAGGVEPPWWAVPMTEGRAVVHQATGIVSVTADVTLAQALVLLRARAYANSRPVHVIAADVVSGATRVNVFRDDGEA